MAKPAFDIDRLTPDQRLELIERLWDSLNERERDALPLTPEQQQELDRRLAALEREGPEGLTPDEVRLRLKRPAS